MKNLQTKKLFFLLFFLLMLSCSAFAWDSYQSDDSNTGYYFDLESEWNTVNKTYTTINDGVVNFQPLLIDIDNDGTIEVIGSDGNYLKLWVLSGGTLSLKAEHNFGDSQKAMISVIPNYDSDAYTELLFPHGTNNLTIIEYNGSEFVITKSFTDDGVIATAPICFNTTHSLQTTCVWGNNVGNISETTFNGTEFPEQTVYNMSDNDIFSTTRGLYNTPALADGDNDGADEIIWICDNNTNGAEGICMTDISSISVFDSYFSTHGIIDDLDIGAGSADSKVSGIVFTDLEEGGDSEIIISYYSTGGTVSEQDAYFIIYHASGSTFKGETLVYNDGGSSTTMQISMPVVADFINTILADREDICFVAKKTSSSTEDATKIICYDDTGNKVFEYITAEAEGNQNAYWIEGGTIAGAELYDDTDGKIELVVGGAVLSLNNGIITDTIENTINFTTSSGAVNSQSSIAISDVNADLSADVCGMRNNFVSCTYISTTNNPPVLSEFDINTGNPVCAGQSITIDAEEGIDYSNDLSSDTERIKFKYSNGTFTTGSYSSTNPSLTFIVPEIGTYTLTIYLQDLVNSGDLTQYSEYSLIVANTNLTCNNAGEDATSIDIYTATLLTADDLDEQVNQAFEDAGLGMGVKGKAITLMIVLLYVLFSILSSGAGGIQLFASVTVGFIAVMVIGFYMGWIPGWILLLCGFIAIAMIVNSVMNGNGGS